MQGPINIAQPSALWLVVLALGSALLLSACGANRSRTPVVDVPGGDPARGQAALTRYGCESCHIIPGLSNGAHVGPPLNHFARRSFVGGVAPNTTDNLILWLQDPQLINPLTAMPNLGVTPQDALDMAAYLYTLD
jgi:cytochrome c